jgi:hypothetical protein
MGTDDELILPPTMMDDTLELRVQTQTIDEECARMPKSEHASPRHSKAVDGQTEALVFIGAVTEQPVSSDVDV